LNKLIPTTGENVTEPLWRQAEIHWGAFLSAQKYAVTPLSEATGNSPRTQAPLISVGGAQYRAPDFQTSFAGKTEFWEVKYRTFVDVDPISGEYEFWMEFDAYKDYAELSAASQTRLWVIVCCANYAKDKSQWFRANISSLRANGRRKNKIIDGSTIDSWVWPVDIMELVNGPDINFTRQNKTSQSDTSEDSVSKDDTYSPTSNQQEFLDLALKLGLNQVPLYSVVVFSENVEYLRDCLKFIDFGIRVFCFSSQIKKMVESDKQLRVYQATRMLEYGDNHLGNGETHILSDGLEEARSGINAALEKADKDFDSNFNLRQFEIVHSSIDQDVLVEAGAGTGKTETMSERILFLLSTFRGEDRKESATTPYYLSPKAITLITFTKEAAKQMRSRISRTLIYRQRLCAKNIHPITAWLMQSSQMNISTIHSFSRDILRVFGSSVGLSPEFRVSAGTMEFKRDVHLAIQKDLAKAYDADGTNNELPPIFKFEKFIEELWNKIEGHGIDLLGEPVDNEKPLIWGSSDLKGIDAKITKLISDAMEKLGVLQRVTRTKEQTLSAGQLVQTALRALKNTHQTTDERIKFIFIDEFQDTDVSQIELILELKNKFDCGVFAVGDKKQGIYKFRGAQGDALESLVNLYSQSGFKEPQKYKLVKNFRSGAKLLSQLDPIFKIWGSTKEKFLSYDDADKLVPGHNRREDKSSMTTKVVGRRDTQFREVLFQDVKAGLLAQPNGSVAVLCRTNYEAISVKEELKKMGQDCNLVVGGQFFNSLAVKEAKALLLAVANSSDESLCLQALETRWAPGLLREQEVPDLVLPLQTNLWREDLVNFHNWESRFRALISKPIDEPDFLSYQMRLDDLKKSLNSMSFIDWFISITSLFSPALTEREGQDEIDRKQYAKNLDHLVALMDEEFTFAPISLQGALNWLSIKIATNTQEDEPLLNPQEIDGYPTAITVHKAKGLEFDVVILPFTDTQFKTSAKRKLTKITVISTPHNTNQLLWRWPIGTKRISGSRYPQTVTATNTNSTSNNYWLVDDLEVIREECRLLYVALTRAKSNLVIYMPQRIPKDPASWSFFLDMVGK
jgi:superfamily I DNA/RNA helicase